MKRVLITGATGFVGANLARAMLSAGHEVTALIRKEAQRWRIQEIENDLRLNVVDLADADQVEHAVRLARPDWVFHLAVYGAYSFQGGIREMVRTNLSGTVNLVDSCCRVGFEGFINTGSSSEYGFKDHAPSEDEPIDPASDYAVTKASSTLYCRHAARCRRLPITTLRLYSVYGPWEDPRRLVPNLIVHGLEGKLPPLVAPDTARDYVHVDDVCDAYTLAVTRPGSEYGQIYNVGTGTQTTLAEIVAVTRDTLGIAAEPVWGSMAGRAWDTSIWVADNRRIRSALGWEPRTQLPDGLRRTAAWFREDPGRVEQYQALR